MKAAIKRMVRKACAWYVEPLYQENDKLRNQLTQLCESNEAQLKNTAETQAALLKRITDIENREEWTRTRFEEHASRLNDIEQREGWTRTRFEEMSSRIADIEHREEWTRNRFEEQDRRVTDIEEREEWTRNRLSELTEQIGNRTDGISAGENDEYIASYAQSGEDAIISYILKFLQIQSNEITYLDLGANHAKELSNTFYFYKNGGHGVLVEANPELISELQAERPDDVVLNRAIAIDQKREITFYVLTGDGLSTTELEEAERACKENPEVSIKLKYTVKTCMVNQILEEYFIASPMILSIDLEGIEEAVLEQIDFDQWQPTIIVLENIPYTPLLSIDHREFRGVDFLNKKGYTEYAFTGINSIFVHRKVVDKFNEKRKKELEKK